MIRAARAGWQTIYVRDSSVAHVGSASTGYKDRTKPTARYWYASRRRYFLKNHGRLTLWAANVVYVVGGLARRARFALMRRESHEPRGHMRGFLAFNLFAPASETGAPDESRRTS